MKVSVIIPTHGRPELLERTLNSVIQQTYKNLEIKQLPPDDIYDNTYLINAVTSPGGRINYYKEFRLHYQYRLSPTEPFKEVKGILRLEYNPNSDLL